MSAALRSYKRCLRIPARRNRNAGFGMPGQSLLLFFIFYFLFSGQAPAQYANLYPTNWWVGMKWNKVQILIHGGYADFNKEKVRINYPGVKLEKIHRLDNGKYMAIDLSIASTAKAGKVNIEFIGAGKVHTVAWPLNKRRQGNGTRFAQGVTSSDLVYLLMPDRFSNGDYTNDQIPGMRDQSLNRDSIYYRHGGDIQGVIDRLDYLQDLGVTTVWMTPVLENDMPDRTEHGYAFTDHYKIDPRLGDNEVYKKLSDALHAHGMKLVQDAVYNHVGLYHVTVQDKPTKDWLHEWPAYTQTNYKDQTCFDPHVAPSQKKILTDGWFTKVMPDLNQSNPYVANFLIQHAIWSVEEFGVDGWRIDTYIYNDLPFMNRCNKALMDEYPAITMFGETWVHGVPNQSYFCENNYTTGFKSNLQATTDFQTLFYGITPAINDKFGWTDGVNKLYTTASQDFLYKDPMREVIFLDNHDLGRFYSVVKEDIDKYKMAIAWLMTFRGIPQMYYGMEILMKGLTDPDGNVRRDFKGGWKEDPLNKFTAGGRTSEENDIFNYIRTLARFRKSSTAIKTGKMMQYVPEDGLYVYFRYDAKQTVMCIMNTAETEKEIDLAKKYTERTNGFTIAEEVVTGTKLGNRIKIPSKKMMVLELKN